MHTRHWVRHVPAKPSPFNGPPTPKPPANRAARLPPLLPLPRCCGIYVTTGGLSIGGGVGGATGGAGAWRWVEWGWGWGVARTAERGERERDGERREHRKREGQGTRACRLSLLSTSTEGGRKKKENLLPARTNERNISLKNRPAMPATPEHPPRSSHPRPPRPPHSLIFFSLFHILKHISFLPFFVLFFFLFFFVFSILLTEALSSLRIDSTTLYGVPRGRGFFGIDENEPRACTLKEWRCGTEEWNKRRPASVNNGQGQCNFREGESVRDFRFQRRPGLCRSKRKILNFFFSLLIDCRELTLSRWHVQLFDENLLYLGCLFNTFFFFKKPMVWIFNRVLYSYESIKEWNSQTERYGKPFEDRCFGIFGITLGHKKNS